MPPSISHTQGKHSHPHPTHKGSVLIPPSHTQGKCSHPHPLHKESVLIPHTRSVLASIPFPHTRKVFSSPSYTRGNSPQSHSHPSYKETILIPILNIQKVFSPPSPSHIQGECSYPIPHTRKVFSLPSPIQGNCSYPHLTHKVFSFPFPTPSHTGKVFPSLFEPLIFSHFLELGQTSCRRKLYTEYII